MSDSKKKPLTLKGILALAGAGLLYLVAQVTGIDLTGGKEDNPAGGGVSAQAPAESGAGAPEPGAATKETTKPKPDPVPTSAPKPAPKPEPAPEATPSKRDDTAQIRQLFTAMRSGVQVEAEGEVVHILPDDNEGSRHQLFLCELSNGITLKISHNIDVAPYIDGLRKGDTVRFHGEYEWNEKGGVVHWTHRNTRGGSHPGGWILHEGKKYE